MVETGVRIVRWDKQETAARRFTMVEQHLKLQLGQDPTVVREAGAHLSKIQLRQDKNTNLIKTAQSLWEAEQTLIQIILQSGILMEISTAQLQFQPGRITCSKTLWEKSDGKCNKNKLFQIKFNQDKISQNELFIFILFP